MQNVGGGNFSDDPYARLLAMKMGSMSVDDLKKQEHVPQEAIEAGANQVIGSIKTPSFGAIKGALGVAEQAAAPVAEAELGLADKIRQAAQKSEVKWDKGPVDQELMKFKEMAQSAPKNFFENRRLPEGASASSVPEQLAREHQQSLRDSLMQQRNENQIKQADLDKFEKLRSAIFGQGK